MTTYTRWSVEADAREELGRCRALAADVEAWFVEEWESSGRWRGYAEGDGHGRGYSDVDGDGAGDGSGEFNYGDETGDGSGREECRNVYGVGGGFD